MNFSKNWALQGLFLPSKLKISYFNTMQLSEVIFYINYSSSISVTWRDNDVTLTCSRRKISCTFNDNDIACTSNTASNNRIIMVILQYNSLVTSQSCQLTTQSAFDAVPIGHQQLAIQYCRFYRRRENLQNGLEKRFFWRKYKLPLAHSFSVL